MDIKIDHTKISEIQQAIGFSIGVLEVIILVNALSPKSEDAIKESITKLINAGALITNLYK